jgi:hypothetical protein
MRITESEKKEILSKYNGNTSNELLTYLKRTFPVSEFKLDWMPRSIKQIYIDGKTYHIEDNKKYLVMSEQAYKAYNQDQIAEIEKYNEILHAPLYHIESNGGGSARCMMAEIFLTPKAKPAESK